MPHFVDNFLFKCWYSVHLIRNLLLKRPVLLAGGTLALKHVVLQSVIGSLILTRVSEVDRVALSYLLTHGDVVGGHQDGALVDVASDGVGVAAVVDQGQTCVDSRSNPLQTEFIC